MRVAVAVAIAVAVAAAYLRLTSSRRAGEAIVRVSYVRHGESSWNDHQRNLLALQQKFGNPTEAEIKQIGEEARWTDAPLSDAGVGQGEGLAHLLFAAEGAAAQGPLRTTVRCARARTCAAPRILTSNLRRAIDTTLLGLRPLVSGLDVARVRVVPALQETCSHADCVPLPLSPDGRLVFPDDAHRTAAEEQKGAPAGHPAVAEHVLQQQISALGDESAAYLRQAYAHLEIRDHADYDDRRRIPDDAIKRHEAGKLSGADLDRSVAPLELRLGDIISALGVGELRAKSADGSAWDWLAGLWGASASSANISAENSPVDVIIGAHSRLLREIMWAFKHERSVRLGGIDVALAWDDATCTDACTELSRDGTRLSNVGAVTFELGLSGRTLTLRRCALDAGGKVTERRPKQRVSGSQIEGA